MLSLIIKNLNIFKNRQNIFQFFVIWALSFFIYFCCLTAYKNIIDEGKYIKPIASGIVIGHKEKDVGDDERNYYLKLNTSKKYIKVTEEVYSNYPQGSKVNLIEYKDKYDEGIYPLITFIGTILLFCIIPFLVFVFICCFLVWGCYHSNSKTFLQYLKD